MARRIFDPDKHCGAANRRGERCTRGLGAGTPHPGIGRCSSHGGSTPNHIKSAARQALDRDMRALGIPVHLPPTEGLLEEIARTLGELAWLRELAVAEGDLDRDELLAGERLRAYERWKRQYRELVTVALAHGIAERQIELAEAQAETMGALVAAALDAIGASGDDRVRAVAAARDRFTLINGGRSA